MAELVEGGETVQEEIKILAKEPILVAQKYSSYTINGYNFHTNSYDEGRPVQCSGVALVAQTSSFERGNDDAVTIGNISYYGVIKEIIELDYHRRGKIALFKCDWVDSKWVKTDQFGITTVNFKHLFNTGEKITDEPFILASQATQVYYVQDPIETDWFAIRSKPWHSYDMQDPEIENLENDEIAVPLPELHPNINVDLGAGGIGCVRKDIDGIFVGATKPKK